MRFLLARFGQAEEDLGRPRYLDRNVVAVPALALQGARLGAQALFTMSNDAWFTDRPRGAQWHQAVAAFRSIETRLPQFRVTSNGYSAVIDPAGRVLAGARMGERTLVVGELPVREPPRTLMVAWGDWVGPAGTVFLGLLAAAFAWRRWRTRRGPRAGAPIAPAALPQDVIALPPPARWVAGALRAFARASVLGIAIVVVFGDGPLQSNTLAQIRTFAALVLAPEAAATLVLLAFKARASLEGGVLVLGGDGRRVELALRDVVAVQPWRLPLPAVGVSLQLARGGRWRLGLAGVEPTAWAQALAAGGSAVTLAGPAWASRYAQAVQSTRRGRLGRPLAKFAVLPLLLAIPAFRLHQHIAYGSAFGEYYTFGLVAYLKGFALWWAAWAIGVVLCAGVLRLLIEAATLAIVLVSASGATRVRPWLERFGLTALYLGLPAWLLLRLLDG